VLDLLRRGLGGKWNYLFGQILDSEVLLDCQNTEQDVEFGVCLDGKKIGSCCCIDSR